VEACRGNVAAARSKGQASLVLSENAADSLSVIRSLKSLGLLELSLGHPGEAAGYLEPGLELEAEAGYDPGVLRLVPDAVEALVAAGRPQAARPLVEALEAQGRRLGQPWALATGARARGLLEAASGDLARAQTALEGALREHKGLPQPFELARTLLAMGNVRRRAKRKREAPGVTRTGAYDLLRAGSGPLGEPDPSRARADRRPGTKPRAPHPDRGTSRRAGGGGTDQPRGRRVVVPEREDRGGQPDPHLPQVGSQFAPASREMAAG
jgi:hypothetical protein